MQQTMFTNRSQADSRFLDLPCFICRTEKLTISPNERLIWQLQSDNLYRDRTVFSA